PADSRRRCPQTHPFPTRRSSDLLGDEDGIINAQTENQRGDDDVEGVEIYAEQAHKAQRYQPPQEDGDVGDQGKLQAAEKQKNDQDRKSTRLNSSHVKISYAVFCL